MNTLKTVKLLLKSTLPPYLFSKLILFASRLLSIPANVDYEARKIAFRHISLTSRLYPKIVYPKVLAIFTTTRCNLRCFVCDREGFKGEDLNFDNLHKLKKPIKYAKVIDLTGWGEFFIYPKWKEVLRFIYNINSSKNLIQIISNGTLLSKETSGILNGHIKALTISLNAATRETYNRDMKHGNFDSTLTHIKNFIESLSTEDRAKVRLHFVAHTENYKEIPEFVRLAHSLAVENVSVGNYYINRLDHIDYALFNIKDEYSKIILYGEKLAKELRINFSAPQFNINQSLSFQQCSDPFNVCFISPSGQVTGPCCYAGDHPMGNVYESTFESVWFGDKYQKLRRNRYLPACKTCSPFLILDDPAAHLTGHLKQRENSFHIIEKLRERYNYPSPKNRS